MGGDGLVVFQPLYLRAADTVMFVFIDAFLLEELEPDDALMERFARIGILADV